MRRAVLGVLVAVFLWHVYRAAASAITVEEAVSYNHFVSQPMLTIFTAPYNPANQVLHSLLCSLVLRVTRVTEFSVRLASLAGFGVYLWAAYQLVAPKTWLRSLLLLALTVNPLTLLLLPASIGIWMAAGLFLLAIQQLFHDRITAASVYLGIAAGFNISLLLPAVTLIFLFLHIDFWGRRRVTFWTAINNLFLPMGVLIFAIWILPLVNAIPGTLTWRTLLPVPQSFHAGPESGLPYIARAIRDDLRRKPVRAVDVAVSTELIEPFDFYRRRYALGAIRKLVPVGGLQSADYSVVLDKRTGQAVLFGQAPL